MLLQIGLMLAQFSSMVASFRALFIMRTEAKKSVIYEHHLLIGCLRNVRVLLIVVVRGK
jgi:hypothetical protein